MPATPTPSSRSGTATSLKGSWRTATEAQAHRRRICRLADPAAGARGAGARRHRRRGHRQRRARGQFQPAHAVPRLSARPSRWWSASQRASSSAPRSLVDRPEDVGADRLVNAVAAHDRYKGPLIVVDFGTATTLRRRRRRRQLLRRRDRAGDQPVAGRRCTWRRRKLPQHRASAAPSASSARTRCSCMQSGVFWGYVGLVEGLVGRIKSEFGAPMRTIATGGLAPLFAGATDAIDTGRSRPDAVGLAPDLSPQHQPMNARRRGSRGDRSRNTIPTRSISSRSAAPARSG